METVRAIIHAPTATALERSRRNLVNLLKLAPDAQVESVINAGGVAAALGAPIPSTAICAFAAIP
jgi:hypothetical protein